MSDLAHTDHAGADAGETRRDFLILTAAALGVVGVGTSIWPFIDTLNPARDTLGAVLDRGRPGAGAGGPAV